MAATYWQMTCGAILLFGALSGTHETEPSKPSEPPKAPVPSRPAVLIVYRPGPAFEVGKPLSEQKLRDHGKYMMSLYRAGTLKLAGGFFDDSGGAVVLEGVPFEEGREIAARDPAVVAGIFLADVRPWRLVDWEALATKK